MPALPYAFVTDGDDYISTAALKTMQQAMDMRGTKCYYKPNVKELKRQFEEVRELGPGSAEEWIKGLDVRGKERLQDAIRWEQWEARGCLRKVNSRPNPKGASAARKGPNPNVQAFGVTSFVSGPAAQVSSHSVLPSPATPVGHVSPDSFSGKARNFVPSHGDESQDFNPHDSHDNQSHAVYPQNGLPQRPHVQIPYVRQERSIRDVNEAKAARRAEIEKRCMALDPPIGAKVLRHMDSFQAALQISTPLTESAWEVLKPRLLTQRESAEKLERERMEHLRQSHAKSEERKQQEFAVRESKEVSDREWEATQGPIRESLARYADEIISSQWSHGAAISKQNCSKFAADVLLHAYRRFYEDVNHEEIHRTSDQPFGSDTTAELPSRKVVLEDMKWLFDNKVRSLTERYQKELFLCNGCEGNFKLYGFEAVIQHYAAKHTSDLSFGNVVVHWRAEWPEKPPFHPNPSLAKSALYAIPAPITTTAPSPYTRSIQSTVVHGNTGQFPKPPLAAPTVFPMQVDSGTTNIQFSQPYPRNQGEMLGPSLGPYHHSTFSEYHADSSGFQSGYTPYGTSEAVPQPQVMAEYGPAPGYTSNGPPMQAWPSQSNYVVSAPGTHSSFQNQDLYQRQMSAMAKIAREIWFGTSGIKDFTQSVRIFVVIQHVVSRFVKLFTNEPSISMFIDGLDHNPLMRPVRSLNGLACNSCRVIENSSGYGSQEPYSMGERKLFTLPHLLNHFRSVHLENSRPTVDSQTGKESPRLDWKRDMVELPETDVIADLINAPGMNNSKLQLIASVFPGVFPDPLPPMGTVKNAGPLSKYKPENGQPSHPRHFVDTDLERAQLPEYTENIFKNDAPSRPDSARMSPPSSMRTSEPPGEDEYDPHRPAYLGRIVESYQAGHALSKSGSQAKRTNEETRFVPKSRSPDPGLDRSSRSKGCAEGAYGDQLLRHHDRSAPRSMNGSIEDIHRDLRFDRSTRNDLEGDYIKAGEVNTSFKSNLDDELSKGEVAAADKFLNDLRPVIRPTDRPNEDTQRFRQTHSTLMAREQPGSEDLPWTRSGHGDGYLPRGYNGAIDRARSKSPIDMERLHLRVSSRSRFSRSPSEHVSTDLPQKFPVPPRYLYVGDQSRAHRTSVHDFESHGVRLLHPRDRDLGNQRAGRDEQRWLQIHGRDPSMSPPSNRRDYYDDRGGGPILRVHSPPEPVYSEYVPQRVVQHVVPRSSEGSSRDVDYPEPGERRVEYIPVQGEAYRPRSGRYILTHQTGQRSPSEYVHFERSRESRRLHERDLPIFIDKPRQFDTRTGRPIATEAVERRDYR